MQFLAQFLEILGIHGHLRGILSLRNTQVLGVQSDQIQLELSPFLLSPVFKSDVEVGTLLLGTQGNFVVIACQLEYLGQIGD